MSETRMERSRVRGARATIPIAVVGLLLAVVLLLVGCLGRSPEARLFTLGWEARATDAPVRSELAVGIGPARFPRHLERPQIVRRGPAGEIQLDEFHRWDGGFEGNVLRGLAQDVGRRLASNRVVAHPSEPPFDLDYRVRLHFDELVVGPDDVLRVRARWAIRGSGNGGSPRIGRTDLDVPVDGDAPLDVVRAHERALGELGAALVEAIRGLETESGSDADRGDDTSLDAS